MLAAARAALLRGAFQIVAMALAVPCSAQDAGAPSPAASAEAAVAPQPSDPRAQQIRALIAGTLDVSVEPQSLFDVALDDEAALQIEATRVRALLRAVDLAARPPDPPPPPPRSRARRTEVAVPDAGNLRAELASLDTSQWMERVDLDRARLDFYQLDAAQRTELLHAHAARQEAARPKESDEARRAREADAERARALAAAKAARSEAERIVSEELARLIALESQVRGVREAFQQARSEISLRRDGVLGWQRRVRDAKALGSEAADNTYDAVRRALRGSRDDLSAALDAIDDERSAVPELGADPLAMASRDLSTEATLERRRAVAAAIVAAQSDEQALREERASALLEEIDTLNRERLGLLPHLSAKKRAAITGFTSSGWDQARSEARHLALILRYHLHVASTWVTKVRSGGGGGMSPWRTIAVLLPLFLLLLTFWWGRRRTQTLLRWSELRMVADDRAARRTSPSVGLRCVRILRQIHRPLEWLLLFLCAFWLLPTGARDLLEVQLVYSIVGWILAGSLIVNTINAFAAGNTGALISHAEAESGKLRLRSLQLVGRTVIVFALILMLSSRLVGEGTSYSWVFSTCWFAAIPVFLLLVRWWRGTVFDRLDRLRRKTRLQAWILANRSGWRSFAAAMTGAVLLFSSGAIKVLRGWLSDFDLARRIHAYFFKREIERIGEGHPHATQGPLLPEAALELDPERAVGEWLSCPCDELRAALSERAASRRGGLIVVVGSRGMGKTSLLRDAARRIQGCAFIECRAKTEIGEFQAAARSDPPLLLIDDAHTLIEPRIGGLARFDEVIGLARAQCERTTWIFAIDASLWPLLKRARDARPMFDEIELLSPWDEAQLGALLADRCNAAGIAPSYDDLLDKLPPGADEIDRQDAMNAKRAGYERMLWDHVGGNPGLAMEAWRASLGRDASGVVHVRPLQVRDITKLERLPDSSLFVLRAVLQLAPTTVETVAQATRLLPEEVLQDFRFGKAQGIYEVNGDRIRIAWPWLRAVSRHLERRHLLVTL